MSPLILEGETLGQKHRHYNNLLKEITSKNSKQKIEKINYDDPDIDNIFKIDIAANKKDVDYILEVFKSEDLLYVSRALKQSTWLITDMTYANIINPDYLHSQLLPQMTIKAGTKLMLSIRLNLKDERRVELFHTFYEDKKEFKTACKWLPNCSVSYIEKIVEKQTTFFPFSLVKRLCEKSISILEIYSRKGIAYDMQTLLSSTTHLLSSDAKKYIDIVNSQETFAMPRFNAKSTKIIMKTNPDVIFDNFEKFSRSIDIRMFVKFLKKDDVQNFIMKHIVNKNLKTWFTFDNLKHFIYRIPKENRFNFVKHIYIEKSDEALNDIPHDDDNFEYLTPVSYSTSKNIRQSSNANIYRWYKFAPFLTAFYDLRKLIRIESNPSERNEIFAVLVSCATENSHFYTVLQYYREKHINEPFKFKSHFVNIFLSHCRILDHECWNILNDIFSSMEVYENNENHNNVQNCIKHIIMYKVLHDNIVPDVVQKKFEFDTMRQFQKKLNDEEKEKVFDFLFQFITKKIDSSKINSQSDMETIAEDIVKVLKLLSDWKKNLLQYTIILEKIREIIKINIDKSWKVDLSDIYNVNKSWRKHLFYESLLLHTTQETCMNALKHGPEILWDSKDNILNSNNSIPLSRLLSKVRVYWHQTLAKNFEDSFRNFLNNKANINLSTRGLCLMLPRSQLINLLSEYKPNETKINWSVTDNSTLNIQKCFAKYMHLSRPQPPVEVVLLYAKGDYLQFVLPSVHSILFNISRDCCSKYIPNLIDAPVSLQKHGLIIAFNKVKIDDLLLTSLKTWESSKNPSIRATIFKLVFELLCKEQNQNNNKEIWHVLQTFIDKLTCEENKIIYVTLSQAGRVPTTVKQAYCMKSYKYLKSLPPKANCGEFADSVILSIQDVMETIDEQFVVDVVLESIDENFTKKSYNLKNVISSYLLSTKSETTQNRRFEQIFVPILKKYLEFLENTDKKTFLKGNFNFILGQILKDFLNITINKSMITPIKLFKEIYEQLNTNLSAEENYVLITTWKVAALYVKVIDKYRHNKPEILRKCQSADEHDNTSIWKKLCLDAVTDFAKSCMQLLKQEMSKYFPSIYILFSKALVEIFRTFNIIEDTQLSVAYLKGILDHADIVEGNLVVLKLLPNFYYDRETQKKYAKIYEILGSHESAEVRMHYQQKLHIFED